MPIAEIFGSGTIPEKALADIKTEFEKSQKAVHGYRLQEVRHREAESHMEQTQLCRHGEKRPST
jgi:hypothetical protein